METVRLLTSNQPEWDRWLERPRHDIYHSAAYHALSESAGEGRAFLAIVGSPDRYLAWPYLLRPIAIEGIERCEFSDITSVYGYSGPITHGGSPGDPWVDQALN